MSYLKLFRAHPSFLSYGFLLAFASSFGQTYYVAAFSGEIRAAFDLSHGGFGTVYLAATLTSGLLVMWVPRLIDHIDLRVYSAFIVVGVGIACLAAGLSAGLISLFLAILLLRFFGQGLMSHAVQTSMGRYFEPDQRGKAIGIAGLGFAIGQGVFPIMGVAAIAAIGWRETWLVGAVAAIFFVTPAILWLLKGHGIREAAYQAKIDARAAHPTEGTERDWTFQEVIRDPRFFIASIMLMAPAFVSTGVMFHQVHLSEIKGWSHASLATSFGIYALMQIAFSIFIGWLNDRMGATTLVRWTMLPMAMGCLVLTMDGGVWLAFASMALLGMTGGAGQTLMTTLWPELYGIRFLGSVRAMVSSIMVIATALSPAIFGWIIDAGLGFEVIAIGSAFYGVVGSLVLAIVFRRRAAPVMASGD